MSLACTKQSHFALTLTVLLAVVLCATPPVSAQPKSEEPEQRLLFNGRDLTGWSGNPELWSVVDGQIVGTSVDNKIAANTFLVWEGGEVEDFRLTFKARLEGDNNSGVQYRSELADPKTWKVIGYQMDIHPQPEYTGMLYSEGTGRGIMAERGKKVVTDAETGKTKVVGKTTDPTPVDVSKWHEYSITAQGDRLIHQLDGKTTVEITDPYKKSRKKGILALQLHAGQPMTVYFKDIVLQKLPKTEMEKPKAKVAQ